MCINYSRCFFSDLFSPLALFSHASFFLLPLFVLLLLMFLFCVPGLFPVCPFWSLQGLEVSKPGRYQALTSNNFLEMSDSGVEFTSSGLPLDSDTEAVMTYASHKPLLNAVSPTAVTAGGAHSDSPEATAVPDCDLNASRTPDSVLSASPASNPRSLAAATPDGSLHGAASPGAASRGTAASDSAQTEGECGQKEESAQSTWKEALGCFLANTSLNIHHLTEPFSYSNSTTSSIHRPSKYQRSDPDVSVV